MFKVNDYVYDSNGDYGEIVGLTSNEFGDTLYEIMFGDNEFGIEVLTEFDLTPADDVEIEYEN